MKRRGRAPPQQKQQQDAAALAPAATKKSGAGEEQKMGFWVTMERCGVTNVAEEGRMQLATDPDVFHDTLAAALTTTPTLTNRIIASFRTEVAADPATFVRALSPLQLKQQQQSSVLAAVITPSLVRLLLDIPTLQQPLLDVLFEQLLARDTGDSATTSALLVVSHLQWLHVAQPAALADKLLDILAALPSRGLKRDLLLALPTIVDEPNHPKIGTALLGMMGEMPSDVLEALSHLTLPKEIADDVARRSLAALGSAEPRDIPALLSFVLNGVTTSERAAEVAAKVRGSINLEHIAEQARKSRRAPQQQLDERALLQVLCFALRLNKYAAPAFLRSIAESAVPLRGFDLFCFFSLALSDAWHKRSIALVNEHPALFPAQLIHATLADHSAALHSLLLPGLLNLAETLVRTTISLAARAVGGSIYSAALASYPDSMQTILRMIVTNLCPSSTRDEMTVALTVLEQAVAAFPRLQQFSDTFKGLVDHIHKMSFPNVSRLYGIFAALCFYSLEGKPNVNDRFYNDCTMLLQKQLSNPVLQYKKIGVLGAVAFIQRSCPLFPDGKVVLELYEMAHTSCRNFPLVLGFFYDEMRRCMVASQSFPSVFLSQLEKTLPREFLQNFFVQCSLGSDEEWYPLQTKEPVPFAVSIFSKATSPQIAVLCPLMRIVSLVNTLSSGYVAREDMVLYAPLSMFLQQNTGLSKREGESVCLALFHGIQWLRELLNVFHGSVPNREQVLQRLSQLIEMEERFRTACARWATPRVPLPVQQSIPIALPKRAFWATVTKNRSKSADIPSTRPLETGASVELLFLLTDQLKRLPTKDSNAFCYLLNELQHNIAAATDGKDLEKPISIIAKMLPMFANALQNDARGGVSSGSESQMSDISRDHFKACSIHCILILRHAIELAVSSLADPGWSLTLLKAATPPPFEGNAVSVEAQRVTTFARFQTLVDSATTLGSAVGTIGILELLAGTAHDLQAKLVGLAGETLSKTWPKSAAQDDYIRHLLEIFIQLSASPLDNICAVGKRELSQFAINPDRPPSGDSSHMYGTMQRDTVPVYFRTLFRLLCEIANVGFQAAAPTKAEHFTFIRRCIAMFAILVGITRLETIKPTNEMLADTLRYGSMFLGAMCKEMKWLSSDDVFDEYRSQIALSIQKLQSGTRQMQHLCEYGKQEKGAKLAKIVPSSKKALETVIFSVKQMFAKHKLNTPKYFVVAPLKSRDIHGKETIDDVDDDEGEEQEEEEEMQVVDEEQTAAMDVDEERQQGITPKKAVPATVDDD